MVKFSMGEKEEFFDWLGKKYGFDPGCLDGETRCFAAKLGKRGVQELVNGARGTDSYRNTRITKRERLGLIGQICRLADQGGGQWADGESSIGGDNPGMWIDDETEYLEEQ